MRYIKRQKALMHLLRFGGTLTFTHKTTQRSTHFTLKPKAFKPINKMLKKKKKDVALLSTHGDVTIMPCLEACADFLEVPYVSLEEVYAFNPSYVCLDREAFLSYLDRAIYPEKKYSDNAAVKTPKKEEAKPKGRKKLEHFDWYEHFLEGKRIHKNIDDAEAYADQQEQAFNKNR